MGTGGNIVSDNQFVLLDQIGMGERAVATGGDL